MTQIHKIKLNEMYCDDVLNLVKTAELRVNDRDYKKGDYVIFTSVRKNDSRQPLNHPVDKVLFRITYVLSFDGLFGNGKLDYPWVLFCIKPVGELI